MKKAVFDLLIDLIVKAPFFNDSLICIDEPVAHVNPAVQAVLLRELLKLTPEKSQLWIATHAIGMLRCARDIETAALGTVAFINFEEDFDKPVVLPPTKMDRPTWQRSLSVALDDLAALVSPACIVICEGGVGARFVAMDWTVRSTTEFSRRANPTLNSFRRVRTTTRNARDPS